jgi:hypothetical protein
MSNNNYKFGNIYGPVQTGDGTQFNAGRDQNIAGDFTYGRVPPEIIDAVTELRRALEGLRLTAGERDKAERDLAAIEGATRREPNAKTVSSHLLSFAAGLKEAGALASAGTSIAMSIAKIAHWLGPLGAAVYALL